MSGREADIRFFIDSVDVTGATGVASRETVVNIVDAEIFLGVLDGEMSFSVPNNNCGPADISNL